MAMDDAGSWPLVGPVAGPLVEFLFPRACSICEIRLTAAEEILCDPCRRWLLPEDTWRCPRCGATGGGEAPRRGQMCAKCPPVEAAYRGILAVTPYNDVAARVVRGFKFRRRLEMGQLMSDLMAARLGEPLRALQGRVGWAVPVPLHWTRRLGRGFNQSEALARRMAEALRLDYQPGVLRRVRRTKPQSSLAPSEKALNVAGAFEVAEERRGRLPGILLVDDVVTTGHTIAECARTLAAAGAREVWVAAFARASEDLALAP